MKSIQVLLSAILLTLTIPAFAELSLKTIDGDEIPWDSLKGKWVLINYWASWCDSCVYEIPTLNRFLKMHAKEPVALFAINYDAPPINEQKKLAHEFNLTYPSLAQDIGPALKLGDINAVPITYVFNPQGKLVKKLYGGQSLKNLNKAITG